MCSEETILYRPDYKSFKFIVENEIMKDSKTDTSKCHLEAFRVSDSEKENKALVVSDSSISEKGDDYELPELVVFLQESTYHFVNEKKTHSRGGKCLVENCELDHKIISCLLESNSYEKSEKKEQNAATQVCEVRKNVIDLTSSIDKKDDNIIVDNNNVLVAPNENVERKKKNDSCNIDSSTCTSTTSGTEKLLLSPGSDINQLDQDSPQAITNDNEDVAIMPRGLAESTSQSHQSFSEEASLFPLSHLSALVSHHGPAAPSFRSTSHRSNSSTTSSRSFAFPVLASEWHGSPERMVKPIKRTIPKKRERKCSRFFCCNFF